MHPREPKLDAAISQIRAAGIDCVATSFGFSIQNPELNETALMHAGKEARQLVSVAIVGQGEKEFKHWFARLDYLQIAELIVDAFSRNGGLQPIEGFRNQLMDLDSQFLTKPNWTTGVCTGTNKMPNASGRACKICDNRSCSTCIGEVDRIQGCRSLGCCITKR